MSSGNWSNHTKQYAKDNNITYQQALSCKKSNRIYHTGEGMTDDEYDIFVEKKAKAIENKKAKEKILSENPELRRIKAEQAVKRKAKRDAKREAAAVAKAVAKAVESKSEPEEFGDSISLD